MLTVTELALNRLVPSPRNVRRTGQARIEELAASIAVHGLLQNLTVIESTAKGKKAYEVIAGGRRLAALKLLVKQKRMAANAPIPCHLVVDANATKLSLAENALQEPMHPADQFDAFLALRTEYGMSAEDIAARFGVTVAVVKARLKLAGVSPKLIAAYRQDEMNLDQLSAFTLVEDHAKQERVCANRGYRDRRDDLVAALMDTQVSSRDPLARFVTVDAYVAAGGGIVRDLFDDAGEGFLTDPELLGTLADAKLKAAAGAVRAEGWKWVEVARPFDYGATAQLRRVYPRPVPLSAADQARFDALESEYEALIEEEESEARDAELARIEASLDALRGEDVFAPENLARAGAFVTVGRDGVVRIERGLVRPEDEPASRRKAGANADCPAPLSAALVGDLTAHQTLSLRDALGGSGEAALVGVTHALAAALFFPQERLSCLDLRATSRPLEGAAPGIADSAAGRRVAARHAAWASRLPRDPDGLWMFVAALDGPERLALLAHCAGLSIDAVRWNAAEEKPGVGDLATAVRLDMRADWQPTAAGYFGRVSRERILDAVREGVSPAAADNLAGLKNAALATEAEQRLKGKGWLPPPLRTPAIGSGPEAFAAP